MKMKTGLFILGAICVGLVIGLVVIRNQADDQQKKSADTILDFSNQVTTATATVDGLRQVNLMLTNDLAASRQETETLSNNLVQTSGSLQTAQDQITNLDARVADLQAQNQALDQRAADLTNTIASLSEQITETQIKLVTSETNDAFLEGELKNQVAEKTELQRKFNDLATVRAQVKTLRDDAITARRLEWMRQGIDPSKITKGGEILMQHTPRATNAAPVAVPARPPRYDLNVEVGSDGSVHVMPPQTNPPAATNTPQ
jgi:septal ring factor EnvC (AmiA/AmiB activator)